MFYIYENETGLEVSHRNDLPNPVAMCLGVRQAGNAYRDERGFLRKDGIEVIRFVRDFKISANEIGLKPGFYLKGEHSERFLSGYFVKMGAKYAERRDKSAVIV